MIELLIKQKKREQKYSWSQNLTTKIDIVHSQEVAP